MLSNQTRQLSTNVRQIGLVGVVLAAFVASYGLVTMLTASPPTLDNSEPARMGGIASVTPPHLLPDFTLTNHSGQPVSLSDFRGRGVLMFFGYTHCPDVCPTTLLDYTRVKQILAESADDVAFVFISVDGARDTPDVLAAYLGRYDPDFIGLTGDTAALQQMGVDYGLTFAADRVDVGHNHDHGDDPHAVEDNYFVQHTSPSFLVDRNGYLRRASFYGTDPSIIAAEIQLILAEHD
jgi:protein SCO1